MKKLFVLLLVASGLTSYAQSDSVSLGAGATYMVFYSLSTGTKTSVANDDWHIAFSARSIGGFSFSATNQATAIRINEAYGLKLFRSPTQKLAQFATFDTTGYESWQQMHNPDTTWTVGAFNVNINLADQFNFGWGEYNQGTHDILSDSSVYLIVLPGGGFKKFTILNLLYDTAFNVQFANLDNSNPNTMEIRKSPYSTKNFIYMNLNTATLIDKEPALTAWDMVFLRYNNTTYNSANLTQDIGVLTKDLDSTAAVSGIPAQQSCYSGSIYNDINVIGKTWRDQTTDTVIPGLAYFVNSASGYQYRVTMTDFGGGATGEVGFAISRCGNALGVTDASTTALDATIYSNPASKRLNISLSADQEMTADIQLTDMSGRLLLSQSASIHAGKNTFALNIASIQEGSYVVSISSQSCRINKLLSVEK